MISCYPQDLNGFPFKNMVLSLNQSASHSLYNQPPHHFISLISCKPHISVCWSYVPGYVEVNTSQPSLSILTLRPQGEWSLNHHVVGKEPAENDTAHIAANFLQVTRWPSRVCTLSFQTLCVLLQLTQLQLQVMVEEEYVMLIEYITVMVLPHSPHRMKCRIVVASSLFAQQPYLYNPINSNVFSCAWVPPAWPAGVCLFVFPDSHRQVVRISFSRPYDNCDQQPTH